MSITYDRLRTAEFPGEYADILVEVLAITPANFLSVKDVLWHFYLRDDAQVHELIEHILERLETEAEGK